MLGTVEVQPDEIPWAARRRLPLFKQGDRTFFRLPCSVLEPRAAERVCGDYESRPRVCRSYRCELLRRYERGEVSPEEASRTVSRVRAVVEAIERRVAKSPMRGELSTRLASLTDADALLDLGMLRALIARDFHDRKAEVAGVDVGAPVEKARDAGYWEGLFGPRWAKGLSPDKRLDAVEPSITTLQEDGYCRLPPLLDAPESALLASLVKSVQEAGWPPVFAFVHPAPWEIPRRLHPWVGALLGPYELLSAFWAWSIGCGDGFSGWPPHRDRETRTVQPDGRPSSVTVWVALTDATPDNGCMYVLYPTNDPYYGESFENRVHDVQSVRALPAAAGDALAWNHQVLHWGGRSTKRAAEPRVSLAFEFRRCDASDDKAVIDTARLGSLEERLRLVGEQIVQYQHLANLGAPFVDLGARLVRAGEQHRR
jgi:hypothetical protein